MIFLRVKTSALREISYIPSEDANITLFEVFDKIKKLNGNLFHFGEYTIVAHDSEDKVIDLLRDSTIYISIYLRVKFVKSSEEDVMFYLFKNHEEGLKSAILVATVTPVLKEIQLVRLHGKLSIKASEDLGLHVFSACNIGIGILENSVFTMYIA